MNNKNIQYFLDVCHEYNQYCFHLLTGQCNLFAFHPFTCTWLRPPCKSAKKTLRRLKSNWNFWKMILGMKRNWSSMLCLNRLAWFAFFVRGIYKLRGWVCKIYMKSTCCSKVLTISWNAQVIFLKCPFSSAWILSEARTIFSHKLGVECKPLSKDWEPYYINFVMPSI